MELAWTGTSSAQVQRRSRSHETYLPKEEPHSIFNTATKGGFLPELRTLPPDYNEWLKANGLDPVDVELDEEYDDQWLVKHFAKYSVEPSSQTKSATKNRKDSD